MNKAVTIILVIILVLGFVGAIGYIVWDKFKENQNMELAYYLQAGQQQGITAAVTQIYQETENCQPSVITIGNFSKQLVDAKCLEAYLQQYSN